MTAAMENYVVLVVEPLTSLVEDQIKEASYPGRFVGGAGYEAKIKRATAMNLLYTCIYIYISNYGKRAAVTTLCN